MDSNNLMFFSILNEGSYTGYIDECESCSECLWTADSSGEQTTLDGGGHTLDECIAECDALENCNYASYSTGGYCHLSQHCYEKSTEVNYSRYRKTAYQGR